MALIDVNKQFSVNERCEMNSKQIAGFYFCIYNNVNYNGKAKNRKIQHTNT